MTKSIPRKSWIVLWAAMIMNFFCGLGYIWSIIGRELMTQLEWTSVQSSMPYTIFSVAFAFTMTLAGPLQDRKGPRLIATIGSIMIGGGIFLTGLYLHPVVMIITYGVLAGGGTGTVYAASIPPAMKRFPSEKKGAVNGLILAMTALASVMYSPLTQVLINRLGISRTFLVYGIGIIVILTISAQFLENPPETADSFQTCDAAANSPVRTNVGSAEMLKTGNFYKMWFMFLLSAASSLMVIGHAANIARHQAGWNGGVILVILLALCNALGRFLGGSLSDRLGRPQLMRIVFALQAVNMFLFMFYTNQLVLMIGVAVTGLCYGVCMVIFSASTSDLYGMKNFGANYGLVFTAWGLAGVLGPISAAVIFDASGKFSLAYVLSAFLILIALVIAWTFKIHQPKPRNKI